MADVIQSIEEQYKYGTLEESVLNKDWAAGSSKCLESTELIIKKVGNVYNGSVCNVSFPPALWKIFDEPIVNVCDYAQNQLSTPNKVTEARIKFDMKTGRITIWNNGPGVQIVEHKVASQHTGKTVLLPTFLFAHLFQGGNKEKKPDSITGGTNGIGVKLTLLFSTDCILETVDTPRKLHFVQRWEQNKQIEHEPVITDLSKPNKIPAERQKSHTVISFIPDWKKFGYDTDPNFQLIHDLLLTRAIFMSVYTKIKVLFNDELLPFKTTADIARCCFAGSPIVTGVCKTPAVKFPMYKYNWEVTAVVTTEAINEISNVNGIMVRSGKHTQLIQDKIVDAMTKHMDKLLREQNIKFNKSFVTRNLFLIVDARIPDPSWTGQRKDILQMDIRKLAEYELDTKFINGLRDHLAESIKDQLVVKNNKITTKVVASTTKYEKYWPAQMAGTSESHKCNLMLCEGDSAATQIKTGLAGDTRYNGHMSTGGVPVNCRREVKELKSSKGSTMTLSKKMEGNLFINALREICNLQYAYKYDPASPTYKKEMKSLRYGHIIACVDQDDDGKGNILGSILSTFEVFWPNLLKAGYVQWFCTAIVRAFPKAGGKCQHFTTMVQFEQWSEGRDLRNYKIRYYKGLGTHDADEVKYMFKRFTEDLYTFNVDQRSPELFDIYFGNVPDKRKIKLAAPRLELTTAEKLLIDRTKQIPCSIHLEQETHAYQIDNLERKLDHEIDGQNQVGRMILISSMEYFASTSKEVKVSQLSGYVSEHASYHHGEDSLQNSITGKAFIACGGKQLPILVPYSNFGTRLQGGADSASPRYIFCKLNKKLTDLLFPAIDYPNLPMIVDENGKSVPKYLIPIIPMALIESTCLPAHGWKYQSWGRDIHTVIKNVQRLIRMGEDAKLFPMPSADYADSPRCKFTGKFITIRGKPASLGRYVLKGDLLTINELPMRMWTLPYVNMLKAKLAAELDLVSKGKLSADQVIIQSIHDSSDNDHVNIEVTLNPTAHATLARMGGDEMFTDQYEEYFRLAMKMTSHLNLMNAEGGVSEHTGYESIVRKWFPQRREWYTLRVIREQILQQIAIDMQHEIVRYVEDCANGLSLSKMKEVDMIQTLRDRGYKCFNASTLSHHKKYITSELIPRCTDETFDPKEDRYSPPSYDYLLNLTDRLKSEEALTKYKNTLDEMLIEQTEYNEKSNLGLFRGSYLWEQELDQLTAVVRYGMATDWKYDEKKKNTL